MDRVVFDSDLYIDWINIGSREELLLGRWFARYMSTVVLLELQAGALEPAAAKAVGDLTGLSLGRAGCFRPPPIPFGARDLSSGSYNAAMDSTSALASAW
jgi:hypothetical protein